MQFPTFQTADGLLIVILAMVTLSLQVQRFKALKYVGSTLMVIVIGLVLVDLHIVPKYRGVHGAVITYRVPMSISIYLLNTNLKELAKFSGKVLVGLVSAVFNVCLAAASFRVVFSGQMFEGWKITGMFMGTYTGGSSSLAVIAVSLGVVNETITTANAADYVVDMLTLFSMFAALTLFQNIHSLKRIWPFRLSDEDRIGDGEEPILMAEQRWSIQDIVWSLTIAVIIVTAATKLSALLPFDFASAGRILLISTLSIAAAQILSVGGLGGNLSLGLFFGMMHLSIIGFSVDLASFFGSTAMIIPFCFCVIIGGISLYLLLSRMFKVPYEYVVLSVMGAVTDGTTASLVASSAKWSRLVSVGLFMGVIGGVCGNHVGIVVACLIEFIIGV